MRTELSPRPWLPAVVLVLLPLAVPGRLPAADIRMREVASAWGLDFRHHTGQRGDFFMVETMGSGVALLDFDLDGDEDVLFVDSGDPAPYRGRPPMPRLYRNDGGRFVDVTERSGLGLDAYGMGVTAGDVDGDGDPDVYLTAFGRNQLWINRGDGSFEESTERAGVGDASWGTSAAFADVDRDGWLDLYVTNYVDFDWDNNRICGIAERKLRSYCHPDVYNPLPDRFYHGLGDGRFRDDTDAAGFARAVGSGLGVVFGDLDLDGWPDLYVANDMTPNFEFHNRGDGSFEDVALLAGTALSDRGEPEASMGVDMGDLNGDGRPDLMTTHLDQQTNAAWANTAAGIFLDSRFAWGLGQPSLPYVGFGVAFVDLDLDGALDVVIANGHIIHNVEEWHRGTTYRQPNQIFHNTGDGHFEEVQGSGMDEVRVSRGLAVGDLDGDGDADVVISNSDDLAEVYENRTSHGGGWLEVDLLDPTSPNHRGIGARLELVASGRRQVRQVRTGSSYLSQSSLSALFGLGDALEVEELTVVWPDASRQLLRHLPAGRRVVVTRSTSDGAAAGVPSGDR